MPWGQKFLSPVFDFDFSMSQAVSAAMASTDQINNSKSTAADRSIRPTGLNWPQWFLSSP
jgi:hypothetical protein